MTGWLGAAAVVAVADWVVVAQQKPGLERLLKPLVMVLLIGAALTQRGDVRNWIVAGLVFSLAGDIFLIFEKEQFIAGLASFLVAHICYSVGLFRAFGSRGWMVASLIILIPAIFFVARPIVRAVAADGPAMLARAVGAYMVAISIMVALAFGTQVWLAVVGAVLFFVSDAVLGWNKFVVPIKNGRVYLMICYHLGQALLVAALPLLG